MKVTYEIENGKKVKVESYDNGSVYKHLLSFNPFFAQFFYRTVLAIGFFCAAKTSS